MLYAVHDQDGFPCDPEVTAELPDDLIPVPPGHRTLIKPWVSPGRDGGGVLLLWVPEGDTDPFTDTTVPITIRTTTINLKQLKAAGLKPGLMSRETLQARLLDYMRISISQRRTE